MEQDEAMERNMRREKGFSLIELMVAMAVTLIIVAATLGLFETALRTNESSTELSNMNGNLRSAMNLISRDLLQAGQGIPTGGIVLPAGTGCTNVNRPVPVGAAQFPYGCTSAATNPNLPAVIPGNALGPIVPNPLTPPGGNLGSPNLSWLVSPGPNSDIITLLYQDNTLVTNLNNPLAQLTASSMTFSATVPISGSGVSNPANPGDLWLVSGASAAGSVNRLVVATKVSGQQVTFLAGDAFNLNQQASCSPPGCGGTINDFNTGGAIFPANCPGNCTFTAQRVLMISYWLDVSTVINGQVVPRLMRQVDMTTTPAACSTPLPPPVGCPLPVAEVIEGFELSYDYVNTSAAVPINNQPSSAAAQVACGGCTITDNQIRKVNIYLAGRSDEPLTRTNQYLRTNLATQIDVRSLAFVNRYH
jgi:prepilin-type N-terminal cleavage/methylation domain-containing protein